MVTKSDFQKIVKEFNLVISEKHNIIEENDITYAKLPGVTGFLMAWDDVIKKTIIVAQSVERQKENVFFYGADGYDDYEEARSKVEEMIKRAKEVQVETRIYKIETDFK